MIVIDYRYKLISKSNKKKNQKLTNFLDEKLKTFIYKYLKTYTL